jgi:hypothetical protein
MIIIIVGTTISTALLPTQQRLLPREEDGEQRSIVGAFNVHHYQHTIIISTLSWNP